jgi:ribonuclease III
LIDARRRKELEKLLERLGIGLDLALNWQLLDQALVHPTYSSTYNNDHLELLGDSVLRLAVSLFLREAHANSSVGEMSRLRSHLVSDKVLAQIAESYGLDRFMVMAESTRRDPRSVRSRLADALEALLAALYLTTGNLSLIRPWLDPHLTQLIRQLQTDPALGNHKASLQELTQAHWKLLPEYRPIEVDKTPNEQIFGSEVWLLGRSWGQGQGGSIKAAQQAAAAEALQSLAEYLAGQAIEIAPTQTT